jgi:hypothetical protein
MVSYHMATYANLDLKVIQLNGASGRVQVIAVTPGARLEYYLEPDDVVPGINEIIRADVYEKD